MICPYCKHKDLKVVDKRESDELSSRRRRECISCGQRFTTYERIEPIEFNVIKNDGSRETYDLRKIRNSIELAIPKRPVAEPQVVMIVKAVDELVRAQESNKVTTRFIGEQVMKHLNEADEVAAIRYASVYKSFKNAEAFSDAVKGISSKK